MGGKLAAPKATKGKRAKGKKKRSGLVAQRTKKVPVAKEEDIEETEEDKINDIFVEQSGLLDMEDIGGVMMEQKKSAKKAKAAKGPAEMVTPRQRALLDKGGLQDHRHPQRRQAVPLDQEPAPGPRRAATKHTCYGITSYQCMEATPQPRVCQQVHLLLEAPQEPRRHQLAVEGGRPGDDRGEGAGLARPDGQTDEGRPRGEARPPGRSANRAALRPLVWSESRLCTPGSTS